MIGFVFLSLLPLSLVARGQDTETTRRAPSQEEVTIHDGQQEKSIKSLGDRCRWFTDKPEPCGDNRFPEHTGKLLFII